MKSPDNVIKAVVRVVAPWIILSATGCGGGHYAVRGKVVFPDGKPLSGGMVIFQKSEGESELSVDSPIQEDGTFELRTLKPGDGVPPGTYRVLIRPRLRTKKEMLTIPPFIDPKYERFATSGIVLTVEAKENYFEIKVTKPSQ